MKAEATAPVTAADAYLAALQRLKRVVNDLAATYRRGIPQGAVASAIDDLRIELGMSQIPPGLRRLKRQCCQASAEIAYTVLSVSLREAETDALML